MAVLPVMAFVLSTAAAVAVAVMAAVAPATARTMMGSMFSLLVHSPHLLSAGKWFS
jgi:hypothetical protein